MVNRSLALPRKVALSLFLSILLSVVIPCVISWTIAKAGLITNDTPAVIIGTGARGEEGAVTTCPPMWVRKTRGRRYWPWSLLSWFPGLLVKPRGDLNSAARATPATTPFSYCPLSVVTVLTITSIKPKTRNFSINAQGKLLPRPKSIAMNLLD